MKRTLLFIALFGFVISLYGQVPGIPSAYDPLNNAKDLKRPVVLWWSLWTAETFHLQVSDEKGLIVDTVFKRTDRFLANLTPNTTYSWHVSAINEYGEGAWSDMRTFTTGDKPEFVPQLTLPQNGDTRSSWSTAMFNWTMPGGPVASHIQISEREDFSVLTYEAIVYGSYVYAIEQLNNGTTYYWRVKIEGASTWSEVFTLVMEGTGSVGVEEKEKIPTEFSLSQNYPNPFNPNTIIRFSVPQTTLTTLVVYDMLGREVTTLVNEVMSAGVHEVGFNASNLPSGIYFYCMKAGVFSETRRMILLR